MATEILGIHHVSIKCNSEVLFAKTLRFYGEILGLKVKRTWKEGAMFETGGGLIEIFTTGTDLPGEGAVRHFALAVHGVDDLAGRIQAAGYEIFDGPRDICIPSDPPCKARIAFCYGPVGEKIELFDEH